MVCFVFRHGIDCWPSGTYFALACRLLQEPMHTRVVYAQKVATCGRSLAFRAPAPQPAAAVLLVDELSSQPITHGVRLPRRSTLTAHSPLMRARRPGSAMEACQTCTISTSKRTAAAHAPSCKATPQQPHFAAKPAVSVAFSKRSPRLDHSVRRHYTTVAAARLDVMLQ
jgi:hypothetical protein